ncbi:MAG: S49 family peptidase, partial [Acidobacteriota bacterium]
MKKLIVILAVLGAIAFALLAVIVVVALVKVLIGPSVPTRTIVELDLEQALIEDLPDDPIAQALMRKQMTVRDVVEGLQMAREDDHVIGLVARVGNPGLGLAGIQEIRAALEAFRDQGKPTLCWAETFGEFANGTGAYYLATACDEIWLQPSGDVGLTGLIAETPFVRDLLDELDVVPRLDQRHEYKNAMNIYTDREYSAPHREATQSIVDSLFGQIVRGIAERRGLSESRVRELVDGAPYYGHEAIELSLVDRLGYRDEVYTAAKSWQESAELLYLAKYLERVGH